MTKVDVAAVAKILKATRRPLSVFEIETLRALLTRPYAFETVLAQIQKLRQTYPITMYDREVRTHHQAMLRKYFPSMRPSDVQARSARRNGRQTP